MSAQEQRLLRFIVLINSFQFIGLQALVMSGDLCLEPCNAPRSSTNPLPSDTRFAIVWCLLFLTSGSFWRADMVARCGARVARRGLGSAEALFVAAVDLPPMVSACRQV